MSGDFALAIAEGATRIRVGTALFGQAERPPCRSGSTDAARDGRRRDAGGARAAGRKRTAIAGVYGEGATAQLKIAVQAPAGRRPSECGAD